VRKQYKKALLAVYKLRLKKKKTIFSKRYTFHFRDTAITNQQSQRKRIYPNLIIDTLQTRLLQTQKLGEQKENFLQTLHITSYKHGYY